VSIVSIDPRDPTPIYAQLERGFRHGRDAGRGRAEAAAAGRGWRRHKALGVTNAKNRLQERSQSCRSWKRLTVRRNCSISCWWSSAGDWPSWAGCDGRACEGPTSASGSSQACCRPWRRPTAAPCWSPIAWRNLQPT